MCVCVRVRACVRMHVSIGSVLPPSLWAHFVCVCACVCVCVCVCAHAREHWLCLLGREYKHIFKSVRLHQLLWGQQE